MDKTAADRWLEQAIKTHGDSLLRLCFLYLHDRQLAEDAVQETFVRAWRAYGRFRQDSRDKTWLTRIAVNVCKSALRKERPLSLLDAPEGSYAYFWVTESMPADFARADIAIEFRNLAATCLENSGGGNREMRER